MDYWFSFWASPFVYSRHDLVVEHVTKQLFKMLQTIKTSVLLLLQWKQQGSLRPFQGMVPSRYLVYSNEAFEKLPEGTVDDLLQPENKEKLITILKHRVISNVLKANQHVSKPKATTAMVVTYYSA